jgi:hypothetical protein
VTWVGLGFLFCFAVMIELAHRAPELPVEPEILN